MAKRSNGEARSDKGSTRKYATKDERDAARTEQKRQASTRYRERNREKLKVSSLVYRAKNARACIDRTKKWQSENPEKARCAVLRRKYGITNAEYLRMVALRNGRCDICDRELPLVIDHCHQTRVVRGLLCDRCNVALGCFEDSAERLANATKYIVGYATLVANTLEPEA